MDESATRTHGRNNGSERSDGVAADSAPADPGPERDAQGRFLPALDDPALYTNRELSWMDFNDRVLQLAEDPRQPLMERVKFCAIWTSNLDEQYMVRVAGLEDQFDAGVDDPPIDGMSAEEQLLGIREKTVDQQRRASECFDRSLRPELAERGIRLIDPSEASPQEREAIEERFREQIYPVLTPLVIGRGRPFPYISNLSLSLGVVLRDHESDEQVLARVKVPKEALPRFVPVRREHGQVTLVPMGMIIAEHLDELFPGTEVVDHAFFRVTRDLDYDVSDEADDLLQAVEEEVRRRRFGEVVRLEISHDLNPSMRAELVNAMQLEERQVFEVDGTIDLSDAWEISKIPGYADLRSPTWHPVTKPRLREDDSEPRRQGDLTAKRPGAGADIFAEMRRGDILVHHPYDSFATSVERFVEQAVSDPDVLAIKQTVYRTSDDSLLVPALMRAAEQGKQAVCMVELKARFDEEANIQWGRALEEAGVHVVYGFPDLKTHVKAILVVRREGNGVRHYCHLGTGNYNGSTAKIYTDLGLFTCDPEIGSDLTDLFNHLTGYGKPPKTRRVLVAPNSLWQGIEREIRLTVEAHQRGEHARIAMKMNALLDERAVRELYRASQAGVPIDLNVRGICRLRPGVEGVSETITVVSVVGRFLEHSRIYSFERGDERTVYIGSADLMPRNLDKRVELITPVLGDAVRAEVVDVLERSLADEANAWTLEPDGRWQRRAPDGVDGLRDVHAELMERASQRAAERL